MSNCKKWWQPDGPSAGSPQKDGTTLISTLWRVPLPTWTSTSPTFNFLAIDALSFGATKTQSTMLRSMPCWPNEEWWRPSAVTFFQTIQGGLYMEASSIHTISGLFQGMQNR